MHGHLCADKRGRCADSHSFIFPGRKRGGRRGFININTADLSGLQVLPGVGEAKAQAIIDFRETEGPFTAAEDLKNVSGIGDKTFEKLEPLITVQ